MDTRTHLPILFPKVQVPPARLQLVSRQRLLRILDEGLHRKLTLISAPAGYGKTTLLSEWAASHKWPLGWVTLEPGDSQLHQRSARSLAKQYSSDHCDSCRSALAVGSLTRQGPAQ